jgi:hypothetical protein
MDYNAIWTKIRYSNKRNLVGGILAVAVLGLGFFAVRSSTFSADVNTDITIPVSTNQMNGKALVIHAKGSSYLGANAHFNVFIDGVKLGETRVSKNYSDYVFNFDPNLSPSQIRIQYDNDLSVRNLYIDRIVVDGKTYTTSSANYSYGLVSMSTTPDIMQWNGSLRFEL